MPTFEPSRRPSQAPSLILSLSFNPSKQSEAMNTSISEAPSESPNNAFAAASNLSDENKNGDEKGNQFPTLIAIIGGFSFITIAAIFSTYFITKRSNNGNIALYESPNRQETNGKLELIDGALHDKCVNKKTSSRSLLPRDKHPRYDDDSSPVSYSDIKLLDDLETQSLHIDAKACNGDINCLHSTPKLDSNESLYKQIGVPPSASNVTNKYRVLDDVQLPRKHDDDSCISFDDVEGNFRYQEIIRSRNLTTIPPINMEYKHRTHSIPIIGSRSPLPRRMPRRYNLTDDDSSAAISYCDSRLLNDLEIQSVHIDVKACADDVSCLHSTTKMASNASIFSGRSRVPAASNITNNYRMRIKSEFEKYKVVGMNMDMENDKKEPEDEKSIDSIMNRLSSMMSDANPSSGGEEDRHDSGKEGPLGPFFLGNRPFFLGNHPADDDSISTTGSGFDITSFTLERLSSMTSDAKQSRRRKEDRHDAEKENPLGPSYLETHSADDGSISTNGPFFPETHSADDGSISTKGPLFCQRPSSR